MQDHEIFKQLKDPKFMLEYEPEISVEQNYKLKKIGKCLENLIK